MSRADYRSRPSSRPDSASDQLVELHVYCVPIDLWRERYNNMENTTVTKTVSAGIIRVQPHLTLVELREELPQQLEDNAIPREFVFLKSVGRNLTRLRTKQEYSMKAKHFVPPYAYAAELFLLEMPPDGMGSEVDSRSQSSFNQMGESPRGTHRGYNSYRDDYRDAGSKTYRQDHRDRDRYNDKYNQPKETTDRSSHRGVHPRDGRDESPSRYRNDRRNESPSRYRNDGIGQSPSRYQNDIGSDRSSLTYRRGAADLHNDQSSRMQRSGDRVSPSRRFTPIPKLDPSSPTERTDRDKQYHSNSRSPDRGYDKNERDGQYDNKDSRYSNHDDRFNDPGSRNDRYDQSPDRQEGDREFGRVSPDPDSSLQGYQVLPPINNTPPRSAERGPGKQGENKDRTSDPRSATYTTNTNTDSGIADSGVSPEDQYRGRGEHGRDNYEEEMARKRRELNNRLAGENFDIDESYRLEDIEDRDQIDRDRWERDREYRRQWIEEERRRREEEEERRKRQEMGQEEDDDKIKRSESEEELARYPSPPELQMGSPRETESAKQRNREESGYEATTEGERLLKELEAARDGRKITEKEREELVKRAKLLQNKTQNRRNHARDIWKKRYFEEKKKTAPLEEQTNRLKLELDNIHRKLMSTLEGPKEKNIRFGDVKPSLKNNYLIQCTRLQHEIEDLRRRVENAKMKLTAEMKLRNQAEAELRALRAELSQKKINLTLTRNQQLAALNPAGEGPLNQQTALASQS